MFFSSLLNHILITKSLSFKTQSIRELLKFFPVKHIFVMEGREGNFEMKIVDVNILIHNSKL